MQGAESCARLGEAGEPVTEGKGLEDSVKSGLCFSFLTCKMGIIMGPSSKD